jgi:hypothetical protein
MTAESMEQQAHELTAVMGRFRLEQAAPQTAAAL